MSEHADVPAVVFGDAVSFVRRIVVRFMAALTGRFSPGTRLASAVHAAQRASSIAARASLARLTPPPSNQLQRS